MASVGSAHLDQGGLLFRLSLVVLGVFLALMAHFDVWRNAGIGTRLPQLPRLTRVEWTLLALILGSATVLRLYALGRGLWYDEVLTLITYARAPLGDIVTTYGSQNQHLLYSVLAHISFEVFGESAWALRLPAALFGVASLAALFIFARYVTDTREALLATALLAFSYHHIWFSQNARGYSGLLFWALVASVLYVRATTEDRPGLWTSYGVAVAFGMYTHLSMLFLVLGQFVVYLGHLVVLPDLRAARRWGPAVAGFALATLLTLQAYALVIPQFLGPGLSQSTAVEVWNSVWCTLSELVRGLALNRGGGIVALAALVIAGAGTWSYWRTAPMVPLLLVAPALIGAAITMSFGHPLWPRFFLFLGGFGALIAIRGISIAAGALASLAGVGARRQPYVSFASCVAVIVLSASTTPFAYRPKQDFVGAREFVERQRRPDDVVVAVGLASVPYTQYFAPTYETAATVAELRALQQGASRTWVMSTLQKQLSTIHPDLEHVLGQEFELSPRFDGSLVDGEILVYRSESGEPRQTK